MKNNKQDRRSRRTRGLINAAMMECLFEKRYEAITVQDLLDRAGIGRSTFYTHYYDKEDVLTGIAEQQLELLNQQLAGRNAGQEIIPSLEMFQHVHEHYPYFRSTLRGRAGEVFWEAVQTPACKTIEQALESTHAADKLPLVPTVVMAQYLTGAFLNLLKWWLEAEMPYTPEEMDRMFQQLALPGVLATLEGRAT